MNTSNISMKILRIAGLILLLLVAGNSIVLAEGNLLPFGQIEDSVDQVLNIESTDSVTHYLPFSPSVGKVRVSRTGLLYKDYYIGIGYSYTDKSYCSDVTYAFCNGNNGEFHDYQDSVNYLRGAIDFGRNLEEGSDVLSSAPGTVIDISLTPPTYVKVQHSDGTISQYYHIKNPQVPKYVTVHGGQKIAEVGPKDKYSTAPHLHYSLIKNGKEIPVSFADADARQYGSYLGYLLPSRPRYHESYYQSQNTGENNPPPVLRFISGSSQISITSASVNLEVCAANLPGKVVYASIFRSAFNGYPILYKTMSRTATGECTTFSDMDGSGDTFTGVTYHTVASLNPISDSAGQSQRTACYSITNGEQLCDAVQRVDTSSAVFIGGNSTLSVNQSSVNLEVCSSNLSGQPVYATLYRDAYASYSAKIWRYQKTAGSNCLTFADMDGTGDTFPGVTYYTMASLNPISDADASSKRTACYNDTGGKQLCDAGIRKYSGTLFESGYSTLEISQTAVNLKVCAANLSGKNVKATLYRDPYAGYAAKTWRYNKTATSNCVTFSDMDGAGDTFEGVTYYTVASLNEISDYDAASKRTACYTATGGAQLCDSGVRGTSPSACYVLSTASSPKTGGGVSVSPINSDGCPTGSYMSGASVTLTATPTSGYTFQSWTGATGGSTTSIIMSSNKSITANFTIAEYNSNWMPDSIFTGGLDVTISQIRKFLKSKNSCLANPILDVDGQTIDVPTLIYNASQLYEINPKVILATMQKEQSAITKCPSTYALSMLMGANKPSTARAQINLGTKYFRDYLVELQTTGSTRSGWKVNVPKTAVDGVIVSPASRAVAALFTYTPYAGVGWGGNVTGVGGTHLFKLNWDMFNFDRPFSPSDCFTLSTQLSDSDAGSILVSQPPNCELDKYVDGTQFLVHADPNLGYLFNDWSGDVLSSDSSIQLKITSDTNLIANFLSQTCYSLDIEIFPENAGIISVDPPPNCSDGKYLENTLITLKEEANPGYLFSSWSNDFSSTQSLVSFVLDSDKTVGANFYADNYFSIYLPVAIK